MNTNDINSLYDLLLSPQQQHMTDDQPLSPIKPFNISTPLVATHIPVTQLPTPNNPITNLNMQGQQQSVIPVYSVLNGQQNTYQDKSVQRAINRWTRVEDNFLLNAIKQSDNLQWDLIQKQLAIACPRLVPRTREQCYQRWHRVLNPDISKGKWTPEEDIQLLNAIKRNATQRTIKWADVAQEIPCRVDTQVRYRALKIKKWLIANGVNEQYFQ